MKIIYERRVSGMLLDQAFNPETVILSEFEAQLHNMIAELRRHRIPLEHGKLTIKVEFGPY